MSCTLNAQHGGTAGLRQQKQKTPNTGANSGPQEQQQRD